MSQVQALSRVEQIEGKIDRAVVGGIGVSPQKGMAINSMDQAMEVAKLMSVAGSAVPRHLRGNPGACLAVAIQGFEWGINPFAIANKSYEVNDRLGYEAALYHAVVLRRAPIAGRIRATWAGAAMSRTCRVEATLSDGGGTVEYQSPAFDKILTKNSPLWKGDPDQQLFYYSVRAFARRHFPDVMMGIFTADELADVEAPAPAPERTAKALVSRLANLAPAPAAEPAPVEHVEAEIEGEQAPADVAPVDDAGTPAQEADANADAVMLESLEDAEQAPRNLYNFAKAKGATKAHYEASLFKWMQSRGVGEATKLSMEQRIELWKAIEGGTFPPAK